MQLLQLRTRREVPDALMSRAAAPEDYGVVLTGAATVFKPNGQRLITLVPGGISEDAAKRAYPFLHRLRAHPSRNRGTYGAVPRIQRKKADGTRSNTTDTPPVRSAIAGFFDRYPRIPFCRETAFSSAYPEEWAECLPFIGEAAGLFKAHEPGRYAAQLDAAKKTHPAYVIPGTPFTTITVNNCVSGGFHRDAGDYAPGFGVIAVLRRGVYAGCRLVFPAYGVAVDLQDRDVILFDPHEVHGNTPFEGQVGEEGKDWERISVVLYFREKMLECLSPAEELERAKKLRGGDILPPTVDDEVGEAELS